MGKKKVVLQKRFQFQRSRDSLLSKFNHRLRLTSSSVNESLKVIEENFHRVFFFKPFIHLTTLNKESIISPLFTPSPTFNLLLHFCRRQTELELLSDRRLRCIRRRRRWQTFFSTRCRNGVIETFKAWLGIVLKIARNRNCKTYFAITQLPRIYSKILMHDLRYSVRTDVDMFEPFLAMGPFHLDGDTT